MTIEYRLRPVTRYAVTRYESGPQTGSLKTLGEYDNVHIAYEVGYALAKAEADRLQLEPGSMEMIYPKQLEIGGILGTQGSFESRPSVNHSGQTLPDVGHFMKQDGRIG